MKKVPLLILASLLLVPVAFAKKNKDFRNDDFRGMRSYYRENRSGVPPGLRRQWERRGTLPPGLDRRRELPPGLQRRLYRNDWRYRSDRDDWFDRRDRLDRRRWNSWRDWRDFDNYRRYRFDRF
jgi:hypothetical protein